MGAGVARDEVAERVGVSVPTIRKVESGDPTVAIGTVFEVASLLGIAENSVKAYLKRIRVKYTNVDRPAANKLDLFRRAIEDGIVPPVEPKL